MEPFFPLHVFACERCYLVQLEAFVPPDEIFTEYAYFSAYSTAWVEHARQYVEMISKRLGLGSDDLVVELASNDGYLLQHFVGTGIPILGIDPAANVAEAAEERGVPTLVDFFGRATAQALVDEGKRASLIVGQQRPCAGPRPERLRRGSADPSARRRDRDLRVSAPASPARRAPVRHDLPRALLVLLARDDRRDLSRPWPRGLRRRRAVDARRLAARLCAADGRSRRRRPRP